MLKQFISGSTGLLFGFALTGAALADGERTEFQHPYCQAFQGQGCYWMENNSGFDCWVPASWARSFEECFQMDSCDGGLGYSGGGCYKWADCFNCDRYFWSPGGVPVGGEPIGNQPIGGGKPEGQKPEVTPGGGQMNPIPEEKPGAGQMNPIPEEKPGTGQMNPIPGQPVAAP